MSGAMFSLCLSVGGWLINFLLLLLWAYRDAKVNSESERLTRGDIIFICVFGLVPIINVIVFAVQLLKLAELTDFDGKFIRWMKQPFISGDK